MTGRCDLNAFVSPSFHNLCKFGGTTWLTEDYKK
jgi:hypothetical protein